MRRQAVHAVTTLPESPEDDRHRRMIRYAVMMSIRVVCIALMVAIPWPWTIIPALGAIFLPYFAVMVANAAGSTRRRQVERPRRHDRELEVLTPEVIPRPGDPR